MQSNRALASACLAMMLLAIQFAVLRFSTSELLVRVVLPATIVAVPLALWAYRRRLGVWIIFVGVAANLAAILANGGLMPITRATVVDAVGVERAAEYTHGEWIQGSKDVLVAPAMGHLTFLGDQIVFSAGPGGIVVSPGDIVIWSGLMVLVAEVSWSWQQRARRQGAAAARAEHSAEGGAAA